MSRPVVLHVLSDWDDVDATAPLVMSTTASRVVVLALSTSSTPLSPGPAIDALSLTHPSVSRTAVGRAARRHRAGLLHAHDVTVAPVVADVAERLGRPWFVTVDERAMSVSDLAAVTANACAVLVPSRYCFDRLVAEGWVVGRLRLVRPGVALDTSPHVGGARSSIDLADSEVPAARRQALLDMVSGIRPARGHPALDELYDGFDCGPRARALLAHESGARAAELDAMYLAAIAGLAVPNAPVPPLVLPSISVVVPTYNRRELVARTIESLQAQTYPHELTDVVVVDDQSDDGTSEAIEAGAGSLPVRVERPASKGYAAGARNHGIAASHGEIVAFTDDDCRPEPGWLDALVAGFADGVDLVQGRTVPDPEQPRDRWSRTISTPREYGLYETANLAVRRSALEALGDDPFDLAVPGELRRVLGASLGTPGIGEDVDLGWRVRRRGDTRFASHAVVRHHVFDGSPAITLRDAVRAAGFPMLVRRVPELRRVFLWGRMFLSPAHAALVVAVIAVCLSVTVWPVAAVAVAPYLWLVLRPDRRGIRTRLRRAPFSVLRDVVELVGCVVGSGYARRLVL